MILGNIRQRFRLVDEIRSILPCYRNLHTLMPVKMRYNLALRGCCAGTFLHSTSQQQQQEQVVSSAQRDLFKLPLLLLYSRLVDRYMGRSSEDAAAAGATVGTAKSSKECSGEKLVV